MCVCVRVFLRVYLYILFVEALLKEAHLIAALCMYVVCVCVCVCMCV